MTTNNSTTPDSRLATTPEELAPAESPRTFDDDVRKLLAVIHGDGGRYIEQHGIEKAVKAAEEIVVKNVTSRDDAVSVLHVLMLAFPKLPREFSEARQQAALRAARALLTLHGKSL